MVLALLLIFVILYRVNNLTGSKLAGSLLEVITVSMETVR